MKLFSFFLLLATLGYGGHWILQRNPALKAQLQSILPYGELHTLEIRYTAEQIMESQRKELLKTHRHRYLSKEMRFYPYLLMEVKYVLNSKKTEEGVILWDLCDGEIVVDTSTWEKTHGFGDCLTAALDKQEFRVVNALAQKRGLCSRHHLQEELHLEQPAFDSLIERLKRKHLLVSAGNQCRLHVQNPLFTSLPSTEMTERLVTKAGKSTQKIPRRFSSSQVQNLCKAAFGEDFSIRYTAAVYLPVHSIVVQNPDGSLHTSLWNALNGKRILCSYVTD